MNAKTCVRLLPVRSDGLSRETDLTASMQLRRRDRVDRLGPQARHHPREGSRARCQGDQLAGQGPRRGGLSGAGERLVYTAFLSFSAPCYLRPYLVATPACSVLPGTSLLRAARNLLVRGESGPALSRLGGVCLVILPARGSCERLSHRTPAWPMKCLFIRDGRALSYSCGSHGPKYGPSGCCTASTLFFFFSSPVLKAC